VEVARGFIAKGDSADESRDLTAPAGYKELCVVVDGLENCGFGDVSTDIGLDLVTDAFVKEQAEEQVETEDECISGTKSLLPLANINIQAGVENALNPDIALNGIIRVCATGNPGGAVRESIWWKEVGFCGDESLKCWLDTESVKEALERLEAFTGEASEVLDYRRGLIEQAGMNQVEVQKVLSKARQDIEELTKDDLKFGSGKSYSDKVRKIIGEMNEIIGDEDYTIDGGEVDGVIPSGTNADRAEAMALKAEIYRLVTLENYEGVVPEGEPVARALLLLLGRLLLRGRG
jgi:hypothetical protein